jgi:hypothetical protein
MNVYETISQPTSEAELEQEFRYRLDFYWQAIALYALALIGYALMRGTVLNGSLSVALHDPVVLVLGTLTLGSCGVSVANWFMRRSVVIGKDYIRFANRFRTRTFNRSELALISLGKQKLVKVRGAYRVAKIRLTNRRRLLRIRPSLYEHEHALVQALFALKRRISSQTK